MIAKMSNEKESATMTETVVNPEVEASEAMVLVQAQPIEKLFERVTIDPILEKIVAHCRAVPMDVSTDLGRKAVASLAFKIAKTKTFIEAQRVSLVAAEKKRLGMIDSEGKRIRDTLDALKDEIRKPLTEWEDKEKARVERHEMALLNLARTDYFGTAYIEERLDQLSAVDTSVMEEFAERAHAILLNSMNVLQSKLEQCRKEDADRAELVRLRAERDEQIRKEREEQIAAKARADAEERAKQSEVRAKRAEEEKESVQRKAKADADAAVERERKRVEAQKKAEADATAKREADRKHRAKIHDAILGALVEGGLTEKAASSVVRQLATGKIPHVTVAY
jgi:hypothetical protein